MMKQLLIILLLAFTGMAAFAQKGYDIKVKIDGYTEDNMFLGYYMMDKTYLLDTAVVNKDGFYEFEGADALAEGMYLVVLQPDNRFFQVLVVEGEQEMTITSKDAVNPANGIVFKGSPENARMTDYIKFLGGQRPKADALNAELAAAADADKPAILDKLERLNKEVAQYQKDFVAKHKGSLGAAIIKANLQAEMPVFEGSEREVQIASWQWTKKHFWDNIDLQDTRLLRSSFLWQKFDYYINKLTAQHPDSINQSLSFVLNKMEQTEDEQLFKNYLVRTLNDYAKSKIVGMDAVYVHIVEQYYATGKAPWTEEKQLQKITKQAQTLKPLLLGNIAPNIKMQTQEKTEMWLHDFEAEVTVLFFWDPDCGHCKKSMPAMLEFYEQFKPKGVEVFAICTKLVEKNDAGEWALDGVNKCWDFIKEKEMGVWFNGVDPYHRSKYKTVYDIKTTPQIYVLDKDKKIILKRIGSEQLPEVMDDVLKDLKAGATE